MQAQRPELPQFNPRETFKTFAVIAILVLAFSNFTVVINLVVNLLIFIYQFVGQSFGIAIILLTILIRLITWPLNAQQMKGAKAMQDLQNDKEWLAIQKKYAKDREKLAQAEGRLAQLQAQIARIDEAALRAELERAQEQLRALPVPETPVTAEALEAVQAELAARQQAVRELDAQFDQQRGALKHVGGAIARERAQQTQEALAAAKQRERDLELDYEAWRLLAQTLREAETAEGRHLGEALGAPVHERFAALTGGRYGAIALGRDLKAAGVEVAGAIRELDRFSEGVQDQLATILRLAIAEHLGTALVLDDHLVQTDPARVAWFRELLQHVSRQAQIVILTCRPEDYLREDQRPAPGEAVRDGDGLRAVDLSRVIRRAGER